MSEILDYMLASVRNYLHTTISVDDFRTEFAGAYYYARNKGPAEAKANRLASLLMAPIAEFSGGHRSEASLRKELSSVLNSFDTDDKSLSLASVGLSNKDSEIEKGPTQLVG